MMGFVMEAESSSPRCLDLFLPHRTSKERGHKELTRIKGISMNGESQVGASCRDSHCSTRAGNQGGCAQDRSFLIQLSHTQLRKPGWTEMCSAHFSRAVCGHLGVALGVAGRKRAAGFVGRC